MRAPLKARMLPPSAMEEQPAMVDFVIRKLEPAPESCRRPSGATKSPTHATLTSWRVTTEHPALASQIILPSASLWSVPTPPLIVREQGRKG
jgi:hypothetical protein